MRSLILVLFLFTGISSFAQTSDKTGSFNLINVKHSLNNNWSIYVENQWRSIEFFDKFYYYELKGGLTYTLNDNYNFTVGTGIYNTFNEGPEFENYSKQFEYRVWEQINFEHELSIIDFEHRYRIEQRFKDEYANRFRYRLKADVPLNNTAIETNTLFASVSNELFFTDDQPNFARNRFIAAAGYEFPGNITLQAGYLRQVDFSDTDDRRKNYFYSSIGIAIP